MPLVTVDQQGRLCPPAERRQPTPLCDAYWLEERDGDLILHPRLPDARKVYLEPTTACNLQCRSCIRNVWQDPPAHMGWGTFERVMEGLSALPELRRVIFTGFGEPLIHPDILAMVRAVRARGLEVTIGTNGLALSAELACELVALGVDRLVVSLDGVRPETYADIRGGALAEVLANLRALNEVKRQMASLTPALGIEFVALKQNVSEIKDLTGLASRLGAARVLVTNVLPYIAEMRESILYGYAPCEPLATGGWPVQAGAWVLWGNLELPRMHWGAERSCRFVRDKAFVVGWDGGMAPCYALAHTYSYFAVDGRRKSVQRYILGNVNHDSLAEIWMSEDYVRFRSAVREFRFPSCPDCDLRASCDLRERNEGCWGWNPSCADCLWAQDIVRCP